MVFDGFVAGYCQFTRVAIRRSIRTYTCISLQKPERPKGDRIVEQIPVEDQEPTRESSKTIIKGDIIILHCISYSSCKKILHSLQCLTSNLRNCVAVCTGIRPGRPNQPTVGVRSLLYDLPTTELAPQNPCRILNVVPHSYR